MDKVIPIVLDMQIQARSALNTSTDQGADDSGYADSNPFVLNTGNIGGEES